MSEFRGAPILVTGGAGFIGSHLAEELVRQGACVSVVDDLSTGRLDNLAAIQDQLEVLEVDLRREEIRPYLAARGFEYIFHLAGHAVIPDSVRDPRGDFDRNTVATVNLLETVREVIPRARILFSSSAAVYGEGLAGLLREDGPTMPVAPYGVSKLAAERYTSVYAHVYGLRSANG